jgi:hypothetical protein
MYDKISVAADMHDLLMIAKAEVPTHDLLTRLLVTAFLLHNLLLNIGSSQARSIPDETSADSVDGLDGIDGRPLRVLAGRERGRC